MEDECIGVVLFRLGKFQFVMHQASWFPVLGFCIFFYDESFRVDFSAFKVCYAFEWVRK